MIIKNRSTAAIAQGNSKKIQKKEETSPDDGFIRQPEPDITDKEMKALKTLNSHLFNEGFKIGVKKVGLKFAAIQCGVLTVCSIPGLGLGGALALGGVAAAGTIGIMGFLHGNQAQEAGQPVVKQWENIFRRLPEEASMNRFNSQLPELGKKIK